jgi:hypothetical protein
MTSASRSSYNIAIVRREELSRAPSAQGGVNGRYVARGLIVAQIDRRRAKANLNSSWEVSNGKEGRRRLQLQRRTSHLYSSVGVTEMEGVLRNKRAASIGGAHRSAAGFLGVLLLLWYGWGADCACPSVKPVVQLGNAYRAAYVRDGRNAFGREWSKEHRFSPATLPA